MPNLQALIIYYDTELLYPREFQTGTIDHFKPKICQLVFSFNLSQRNHLSSQFTSTKAKSFGIEHTWKYPKPRFELFPIGNLICQYLQLYHNSHILNFSHMPNPIRWNTCSKVDFFIWREFKLKFRWAGRGESSGNVFTRCTSNPPLEQTGCYNVRDTCHTSIHWHY